MLRKDDKAFKKVVDAAMTGVYKSGQINAIYEKWFQKPIPPKGINLNLPMGAAVQEGGRQARPTRATRRPTSKRRADRNGELTAPRASGGHVNYNWNWGVLLADRARRHGHLSAVPHRRPGLDARHGARRLGDRARRRRIVGTLRTTPLQVGGARSATLYVEIFRNIPLIVQMFLWFFVVPELLPKALGDWIKQMPPPWGSYIPAVLCLGIFTSVRVAEQVRAGIKSLPRGQGMAGTALGLTLGADLPLRASCRRPSASSCRRSPRSS